MAQALLLDSVVLIDHFNGFEKATRFLDEHGGRSAISVISRAEVLAGAPFDQFKAIRAVLDAFTCLVLDASIADLAAELRRDHRWKLPDSFQAALAARHGLKLVTRNTKDFSPAKHDFVLVPYRYSRA